MPVCPSGLIFFLQDGGRGVGGAGFPMPYPRSPTVDMISFLGSQYKTFSNSIGTSKIRVWIRALKHILRVYFLSDS